MGLFEHLPYSNFHELNLDWLLKKMKELEAAWNEWKEARYDPATKTVAIGNYEYDLTDVVNYITVGDYRLSIADVAARNQLSSMQADIAALQLEVKPSRVIVLTDSYGNSHGGSTPFTDLLPVYLGLTAPDSYYAYAEGSTGFQSVGVSGHTTEQLLASHASDIADHDSITDIIVAQGANDVSYYNTVPNYIYSFYNYCRAEYPNAKVWIGFVGYWLNMTGAEYTYYQITLRHYKAITVMGGRYLERVEFIMHNAENFYTDNLHPNNNGEQAIAQAIVSALRGQPLVYERMGDAYTGTFTGGNTFTVKMAIQGDTATLEWERFSIGVSKYLPGYTWTSIGTIADPMFKGTSLYPAFDTTGILYGNDSYPIKLRYYNGELYAYLISATSPTFNANSWLGPCKMVLPTMQA